MEKQTIAVDIDDVLAANAAGFVAFSNTTWGTNLSVKNYNEDWRELWQVELDEAERRAVILHESGVIGTYDHYEESLSVLQRLKERYRLAIVTSRRKSIQTETEQWVERNFPGVFESIHFAGIYDDELHEAMFSRTKLAILQENSVDYLIDDQIKHCIAAANAGVQAILFGDYPWNQADELPAGVTRCVDWVAVGEYFDARTA